MKYPFINIFEKVQKTDLIKGAIITISVFLKHSNEKSLYSGKTFFYNISIYMYFLIKISDENMFPHILGKLMK